MITQTEIICLAICQLDHQIEDWKKKCHGMADSTVLNTATAPLKEKRQELRTLYRINTGEEYM
ncbi:MAG: hypothetical protein J6T99_11015 [Oscillospiraceae bacterium]|nr:hypothetical protein [Oscillospiraceae bacterium]